VRCSTRGAGVRNPAERPRDILAAIERHLDGDRTAFEHDEPTPRMVSQTSPDHSMSAAPVRPFKIARVVACISDLNGGNLSGRHSGPKS
jgi:hypothetical protein